jgi:hypothetical protein
METEGFILLKAHLLYGTNIYHDLEFAIFTITRKLYDITIIQVVEKRIVATLVL